MTYFDFIIEFFRLYLTLLDLTVSDLTVVTLGLRKLPRGDSSDIKDEFHCYDG